VLTFSILIRVFAKKTTANKKRLWEQLPKGAFSVIQRNYETIGFRLQGHGPAFSTPYFCNVGITYFGYLGENYLIRFAGTSIYKNLTECQEVFLNL